MVGAHDIKGIGAGRDSDTSALRIPRYVEQLLKLAGINTVRDLEGWSDERVLALDGFDETALAKLKYGLARDGYHIGAPPDEDAICYRFANPWKPKPKAQAFNKRWQDFLGKRDKHGL